MAIQYKDANEAIRNAAGTHAGTSLDPDVSLETVSTTLGEVQASPTSNTLLDRLKQLYTAITGTLTVATHAVTQSGTWNVTNVSGTVSLPTGAATAAKQPALGTAGTASTDVITVQGIASGVPQPVSGTLTAVTTVGTVTNVVHVDDNAGSLTVDGTVAATQSGTWNVTNVSGTVSLPTGAATSALQTTSNSTLSTIDGHVDGLETSASSIDTKIPALGQAVVGLSVPVVLPATQITTLTPPAAITGFATAANQTTGNTSLASLETKIGEVQASPTSNTVLDRLKAIATALAGTLTVATHAVTQSGTWTVQPGNTANTTAWKVDGSAVTQPVSDASGSLTVDSPGLPTALGTTTASASMPVTLSTDGPFSTLTGAVTETAPASDTASSGTNGRLQRIAQRITSLIALLPASLGQKAMSASMAVVVASDQSAVPVTTTIALPTAIYNGLTSVTTAGTRVTLAASQAILSGVTIKAKSANTGTIYVGNSSVSSSNGYALAPGDSVFLEIANLNTVNLDSSVNGEGVTYLAS